MLFTLEKNITPPLLLFDQTQVNFVDHHKYLGITFSRDAKWHEHINTILSSASKILALRKRLRIRSAISVNYHYISVLCPFDLLIRFKCYNTVKKKQKKTKKKKTKKKKKNNFKQIQISIFYMFCQ